MRSVMASIAILLLTSSNAQSQNLNELEHTIRNGSSQKVASLITTLLDKKMSLKEIRSLIYLLEAAPIKNSLCSNFNSHDISAFILSRLSGISLSPESELKVKTIIAHQNRLGKVFRYHIIFLEKNDRKEFMNKVKKWILRNYPA